MIPRTIHQIWLGPAPAPDLFHALHEIVRLSHPGWDVKWWTDSDISGVPLSDPVAELFGELPVGMQADVLRYVILEHFGGWYLDLDMEVLRSLEGIEARGAFIVGEEDSDTLGTAVIGSEAGHPLIRLLAHCVQGSISRNHTLGVMHQTGPQYLTRMVRASPDKDRADAWIAPAEVFYPVHWTRQAEFDQLRVAAMARGTSYLLHHWAGSWRSEDDPWQLTEDRLG